MKQFIGTCVENPFRSDDELIKIIDNAEEINLDEFILNCDAPDEVLSQIKQFPCDFDYYKNGNVYFFTWSAIEHFFK